MAMTWPRRCQKSRNSLRWRGVTGSVSGRSTVSHQDRDDSIVLVRVIVLVIESYFRQARMHTLSSIAITSTASLSTSTKEYRSHHSNSPGVARRSLRVTSRISPLCIRITRSAMAAMALL